MILISLCLPTCFPMRHASCIFCWAVQFLGRVVPRHLFAPLRSKYHTESYCNSRWVRAGFCWPMLSQSCFSNRTKCSFRRPVVFCYLSLFGCIFGAHFCRLSLSVPGSHWVWSWTGSWICWAITWAATFDVLKEPPTTDRNSSVSWWFLVELQRD